MRIMDTFTGEVKRKLEFEASFNLNENIMSMTFATLPSFQRDILLITFPETKVN